MLGLLQIAIMLAALLVASTSARFFGMAAVLGPLAAGILLGPSSLGTVFNAHDAAEISEVSDFGVVLLLFLIRLELRPKRLCEVIGQGHVLGPEGPLGAILAAGSLSSLILWGPPGVGKTTIARLLADETDLSFVQISAIFTGVPDLRKVFESAKIRRQNGQGTLLFVDEIHRFNKAQQDGFLPYMEDGTILLVGATTENPSFELNAALLSRSQVIVLERLNLTDLELLSQRADKELARALPLDGEAREIGRAHV